MKRIFMLVCLLGAVHLMRAQVLTVLDEETDQPVPLAIITSDIHKSTGLTNDQGQADISLFKEAQRIEIRSMGYAAQVFSYDRLRSMSFTVRLTRDDISLDQVVVSATRWNQASRDVPSKVSSISARDIALQNPQTAADLLGGSGEVFIQKSQQGGGSPMIRGFATNRLLYAVDGVRMNTAIFRGGNLQNVINLDPFATERVEVLFGPGSVIYGSDAIGGVMSFQTLTPQISLEGEPQFSGKALMRTSSANKELTAHFDLNAGWDKWALVTSFTTFDFDHLRMGSHGPDEYLRPFYVERYDSADVIIRNEDPHIQRPSAYSQINFMQKVLYRPSDAWDVRYALHYSTTSSYARYDRHIQERQDVPRYGEWSYGPQGWLMHYVQIQHHGYNAVYDEVALRLAYQQFEESRLDRNIRDVNRHIREEKVDALSANLDFVKGFGSRNQLFYGAEVVLDDVHSTGTDENIVTGLKVEGPARYPESTWMSVGGYVNMQKRFSDKVMMQAGARYSAFGLDATFDTRFYPFPYTTAELQNGALTGSLGVTFTPNSSWSYSLNASSGFRSPNVDDAGKVFDSEPGNVMVPNPDLRAEYAYNIEAGLAGKLNDHIRVDLSAYYTYLDDALVRRDFTLNGQDSIVYDGELSRVQAIQNAASATVYGIQAGAMVQWRSGFEFAADINYQKGEEVVDDGTTSPSRHAAPFFGQARVSYRHGPVSLVLYGLFSAKRNFEDLPQEERAKTEIYAIDENGHPYSPAWATVNFKSSYQLNESFTIGAGLENITDLRYRPYSSGIAAPGRNVVVSLTAHF